METKQYVPTGWSKQRNRIRRKQYQQWLRGGVCHTPPDTARSRAATETDGKTAESQRDEEEQETEKIKVKIMSISTQMLGKVLCPFLTYHKTNL